MTRKTKIIIIGLLTAMAVQAQTQQGHVKTLGRPGQKGAALSGVVVRVKGAHNAVTSGANGAFSLSLPGVKNGDPYTIQQVQKQGYELSDKAVIGRRYAYSAKVPLTLVMVSSAQLQADRQRIENKAYEVAERNYKKKLAQLEQQQQASQLTAEQYRQELQILQNGFSKYESLIDGLADHYARTDYDALDQQEREINQCIENGELERAEQLLQKSDMSQRIAAIQQQLKAGKALMDEANEEQARILRQQEKDAEYLYQLYTIALSRFDNEKARFYIETRAELDTTNVAWQLEAGQFFFEYLADYDKALDLMRRGVRQAILQDGELSEQTATAYQKMADVYFELKQLDSSLEYAQKALDIRRQLYTGDNPFIASSLCSVGGVYALKGEFQKALALHQESLEMKKKVLPEVHDEMAQSYFNLGYVEVYLGKFSEGMEDFQKSLDILKALHGENYIHVADTYHNMGYLYFSLGNYKKAEAYFADGLRVRKLLFGENHPDVSESLNGLANVYTQTGDAAKALDYFQQALALRLKVFGEDNAYVATSYNNVGSTYQALGDQQKALEYLMKALKISERAYGKQHPEVAASYLNIGTAYFKLNDYDKALENGRQALDIYKATVGENHANVAACYNILAVVYGELEQYDKAKEMHKGALEVRKKVLGENHPDVFMSYNNIAYLDYQQGRYDQAIDNFTIALSGFIGTLGENHPQIKDSIDNLDLAYKAYLEKHPNDQARRQAYEKFKQTYMK